MRIDIKILGPLVATVDGVSIVPTAPKQRQGLAILALNAGRLDLRDRRVTLARRDLLDPQQKQRYSMLVLEEQQAAERERLLAYMGGNIPGMGVATRGGVSTATMTNLEQGRPASSRVAVQETEGPDQGPEEEPPYEQWTKADLQGEINARNEQREDESTHVRPTSDRKDDLVAALYRDDEENPA